MKKRESKKKTRIRENGEMVSTNLKVNLRPQYVWKTQSRDGAIDVDRCLFRNFRFTPQNPILRSGICEEEREIYNHACSGDETEEEEERIKSSWHHRALLGDDDRVPYNEFSDDVIDDSDGVIGSEEEDHVVIFTNVGV